MKIGIDLRLVYHRQAGISWYALRLLQALAAIDGDNDYILLQHRKQNDPLIEAPNFEVATLLTPVHSRFEQWPLSIETGLLGLDLIHSPDFIPPLHNRIPAVITVHDLAFIHYPNFVTTDAARYYGQIELAIRRANRIIAVSNSTRADLVKLLGAPESKISVIHEAADPFYQPIARAEALRTLQEAGITVPEQFILAVGTIEPRKNLGTLLRAYHHLQGDYGVRVPLVFAGERGWLFDDILAFVEDSGLEESTIFLGKVDNAVLRALYNLATLLVHPAFYEGFGLPPLEAMACGTPVLCSNAGSLPEVVGDAALLVPPEDVECWTVSIQRLLQDAELREELGAKGRNRAQQFSWKKAAIQTLAVYKQAITG